MSDPKVEVLTRLLALARLIRRKGSPAEATAVLPYEEQLEHDLAERKGELAELPGFEKHEVAA